MKFSSGIVIHVHFPKLLLLLKLKFGDLGLNRVNRRLQNLENLNRPFRMAYPAPRPGFQAFGAQPAGFGGFGAPAPAVEAPAFAGFGAEVVGASRVPDRLANLLPVSADPSSSQNNPGPSFTALLEEERSLFLEKKGVRPSSTSSPALSSYYRSTFEEEYLKSSARKGNIKEMTLRAQISIFMLKDQASKGNIGLLYDDKMLDVPAAYFRPGLAIPLDASSEDRRVLHELQAEEIVQGAIKNLDAALVLLQKSVSELTSASRHKVAAAKYNEKAKREAEARIQNKKKSLARRAEVGEPAAQRPRIE